jgi:hypothetical protein
MNFTIHTLLIVLGVQALSLHGGDVALAFLFGVGADLDHLVKVPQYINKHGFKKVRRYNWRTPLQEPVSLLWIIPLSVYISSYVPIVFFIGHLLLDYCVSYIKKPLFPFLNYETRGFLSKTDNTKKDTFVEVISASFLICLNLALILLKK